MGRNKSAYAALRVNYLFTNRATKKLQQNQRTCMFLPTRSVCLPRQRWLQSGGTVWLLRGLRFITGACPHCATRRTPPLGRRVCQSQPLREESFPPSHRMRADLAQWLTPNTRILRKQGPGIKRLKQRYAYGFDEAVVRVSGYRIYSNPTAHGLRLLHFGHPP